MPMWNLTIVGNNTGVLNFVQLVNSQLMEGHFGHLILIVTFSIALIGFIVTTRETGKAILASSFITLVFAMLLRISNLVSNTAIYICFIVTAAVAVLTMTKK